MKINSIKNDFAQKPGIQEAYHDSHQSSREKSAGLCEKNTRGYNIAFNGSLPGIKSGAAVNVSRTWKMKSLDWLLEFAQKHNVAGSALMALFLAGALRPATIMALPGKNDKDDKMYAAGHSMASGLIGFGVSTVVTSPWDDGVAKIMQNYKNHYDTIIGNLKHGTTNEPEPLKYNFKLLKNKYERLVELQKNALKNPTLKKECRRYIDTLALEMKNITDWVIAVPRSMLTIALIPPILKYVFGLEKKKSAENKETAPAAATENLKQNFAGTLASLPNVFNEIKGGQK